MTIPLSYFDLPKEVQISDIIRQLQNGLAIEEHPSQRITRVYLDTFDWRLFAANLQLQCDIADKTHTYTLRNTDKNRMIASLRADKSLWMIEDFPESTVKKHLATVIEMRALLPVVSLHCQLHPLTIRNAEQKIVVKLSIEKNHILKKFI